MAIILLPRCPLSPSYHGEGADFGLEGCGRVDVEIAIFYQNFEVEFEIVICHDGDVTERTSRTKEFATNAQSVDLC
jgi:hypothetical protein